MADKNLLDNRNVRVMLNEDKQKNAGPTPTLQKSSAVKTVNETIKGDADIDKNPIFIVDANTMDEWEARTKLKKALRDIHDNLEKGELINIELADRGNLTIERSLQNEVMYKLNGNPLQQEDIEKNIRFSDGPSIRVQSKQFTVNSVTNRIKNSLDKDSRIDLKLQNGKKLTIERTLDDKRNFQLNNKPVSLDKMVKDVSGPDIVMMRTLALELEKTLKAKKREEKEAKIQHDNYMKSLYREKAEFYGKEASKLRYDEDPTNDSEAIGYDSERLNMLQKAESIGR